VSILIHVSGGRFQMLLQGRIGGFHELPRQRLTSLFML
jgi:hypothetical protein